MSDDSTANGHFGARLSLGRLGENGGAASVAVPTHPRTGGGGGSRHVLDALALPSFDDLDARAERLIQWADEETRYLAGHEVRLFRAEDVQGRTRYAEEGLYELLPRLNADAARLRAACGRGLLWDRTWALCQEASRDVQAYCSTWEQARRRLL